MGALNRSKAEMVEEARNEQEGEEDADSYEYSDDLDEETKETGKESLGASDAIAAANCVFSTSAREPGTVDEQDGDKSESPKGTKAKAMAKKSKTIPQKDVPRKSAQAPIDSGKNDPDDKSKAEKKPKKEKK